MEILIIVGYKDMSFKGNDGNEVSGRKYYFTRTDPRVKGCETGNFFLTVSALNNVGYVPEVDEEVEVYYNRYGKVSYMKQPQ